MTFFVPQRGRAAWVINSYESQETLFSEYVHGSPAFASNNFTTVGVAVFIPLYLPEPVYVTEGWWQNGAAVAGNLDVGVYDEGGNRLCSTGNTGQVTISVVQSAAMTTPTWIGRGTYYLAMSSDTSGITQKVQAATTSNQALLGSMGLLEASSANPLPSTVTYLKYARAFWPLFGIQITRSVGP